MGPQKALETVGNKLQEQYERWQARVSLSFMLYRLLVECKIVHVLWGFGGLLCRKLCDFSVIDLAGLFRQMQYRWNKILNKTIIIIQSICL